MPRPGGGEGRRDASVMPALSFAGCPLLLTASGRKPMGPRAAAPLSVPRAGGSGSVPEFRAGSPYKPSSPVGHSRAQRSEAAGPGRGGGSEWAGVPRPRLEQGRDSFQAIFPKCRSQWNSCLTSYSNVAPWPSRTHGTGAVPHTTAGGRGGPRCPPCSRPRGCARRVPCRLHVQVLQTLWRGRAGHPSPMPGAPAPALTVPRCFRQLPGRGLGAVHPVPRTARLLPVTGCLSPALPTARPTGDQSCVASPV